MGLLAPYRRVKRELFTLRQNLLSFEQVHARSAGPCTILPTAMARHPPGSWNGQPAYGDAFIEGTIGEPSNLIPMLASDSASHSVSGLIFNGLVKYDTDLSVTGDLAESWNISKDGLVITFRLRKGVNWTDGVEFTAEDVMFGYKTIIDEKTPSAYK